MQMQRSDIAQKAWNLLRLALLWPRKGGVFKRRLAMDLRLFLKFLKTLGHSTKRGAIHYGEREFSFDNTPIIHVKMHRPSSMRFRMPRIPCINPPVDFDYDFQFEDEEDDGDVVSYDNDGEARKSFSMGGDDEDDTGCEVCDEMVDEAIDRKAEEFIVNFYNQMKLQRQNSYVQCNEMINRVTS